MISSLDAAATSINAHVMAIEEAAGAGGAQVALLTVAGNAGEGIERLAVGRLLRALGHPAALVQAGFVAEAGPVVRAGQAYWEGRAQLGGEAPYRRSATGGGTSSAASGPPRPVIVCRG